VKDAYYLPTPSDVGVVVVRKWMDKFSKGGVQWLNGDDDGAVYDGEAVNVGDDNDLISPSSPLSSVNLKTNKPKRRLNMPKFTTAELTNTWDLHGKDCNHCINAY
jgi:hypothetical protein